MSTYQKLLQNGFSNQDIHDLYIRMDRYLEDQIKLFASKDVNKQDVSETLHKLKGALRIMCCEDLYIYVEKADDNNIESKVKNLKGKFNHRFGKILIKSK